MLKISNSLFETNSVNNNDKLEAYLSMLELSYTQAIQKLLVKYGPATSDYYKENSYARFLNGEIKSITRGKYQRTKEGLYCHHIDEFKFENLSNKDFIKELKYPHFYQKKDRLVYCDLLEHLILHTLIAKETHGEFGLTGYQIFIRPMVEDWYVYEIDPKPGWMKICKERAYLNTNQINILLTHIDIIINKTIKIRHMKKIGYKDLNRRLNFNMTIKEYSEFKNRKLKMKEELESNITRLNSRRLNIQYMEEMICKELKFYKEYPLFKTFNVSLFQTRQDIINDLYEHKYKEIFSTKKELRSYKINTLRDKLFEELHSILKDKY